MGQKQLTGKAEIRRARWRRKEKNEPFEVDYPQCFYFRSAFIQEDETLDGVARLIDESNLEVVGVSRDGMPVGTISNRELLGKFVLLGRDFSAIMAKQVMSRRPVIIEWPTDDSDLIDAAITMQRKSATYAIVTCDGQPVGFITYGALMRYNLGA